MADGYAMLECPRWRGDRLYLSELVDGDVLELEPDGCLRVICHVPGGAAGTGWDTDGRLLVVALAERKLFRLAGAELELVADLAAVAPGPTNDFAVGADGSCYVGNFGAVVGDELRPTVLARISPNGELEVAADELWFPNGMAITPNGSTLLVAETFAFRITAFTINSDGSLSDRRTWCRFGEPLERVTVAAALAAGAVMPDGICLDADGALWVADAGGSGALRVTQSGELLDRVEVPGSTVYGLALGGSDGHTLFLCAGAALDHPERVHERQSRLLACNVAVGAAEAPTVPKGTRK